LDLHLPKVAYILHWFPEPSETFVFSEVINLRRRGLPLKVYTLYGKLTRWLSPEMLEESADVARLGLSALKGIPADFAYWFRKDPSTTRSLLRLVPFRRWSCLEQTGENLWAFLCGFRLARLFEKSGIEHIHAPWANGPATAAWVASRLTGIPFSFTARAGDIYPPDGALAEKIHDALFVRTETKTNIGYLAGFAGGNTSKFLLTYNGLLLKTHREAPVSMCAPCKILGVARFVRTKGFDVLLRAAKLLEKEGLDFHLTLAGAGPRRFQLRYLVRKLGLTHRVTFPGFVPHDRISDLFYSSDVFVMPSIVHSTGDRDGIPTVIMEALLHRLPVVASDVSGVSEVIRNGETGLLVQQRDPPALAKAIRTVLGNRETALKMAEKGQRLILELFDPEKNHKNVFDLYSNVVTGGTAFIDVQQQVAGIKCAE
jgi:glycosyltransferase involved in cell wall biosynthesis